MPLLALFVVGLVISIFWMTSALERGAWASLVLCVALFVGGVYGAGQVLENRPYETITKKISVVDNKPVIFVDDTIILVAKKTGEMYNDGDVVTFKYMSNYTKDKYIYFGDSVDSRVRDITVVGGECKTGEVK